MLKIDIWSDYACPYCYIGKQQLFQALKELNISDYECYHHVFVLDPGKVNHPERTYLDGLNLPDEEKASVIAKFKQIEKMAADVGLHYNMLNIKDVGTEDAHRLTLWAQTQGLHMALNERLFKANFEENLDISSHSVLLDCAEFVGLDRAKAEAVLTDAKAYLDEMFADFEIADEKEIDLVPHYTFNNTIDIAGIMTVEAIKKQILQAL